MAFIVDSTRFQAEGAFLNWGVVARRLGIGVAGLNVPQFPNQLQLRWTLKDELGLPTEPFTVWRRAKKLRGPKPIAADVSSFQVFGLSQLVDLKGSYSTVEINVSGGGGAVYAWVGFPWLSSVVAIGVIAAGNNVTVTLTAPSIEGLLVSNGVTFNTIKGVGVGDLSAAAGWEKFEYVGLPVKKTDWADQGIGKHGVQQGMFSAPTDAVSAAKQRLERGAPPFGWGPTITTGVPAPTWIMPQADPLIVDLNKLVLDDLRLIAGMPAEVQAAQKVSKAMPPPENSSGQQMTGPGSTSQISPLNSAYMSAASDCFQCLALGFGTAYPVVQFVTAASIESLLDFDWMITARYEKGTLGSNAPVEYAAVVPSPVQANAVPVPANMAQQMMGNLRPPVRDGDWRASVKVSWDRPVPVPLFRPRSFAFARSGVTPASAAALVMGKRADGSPVPLAVNYFTNAQDPEPNRLSAVEREIPIPNDPGNRTLKYAAAHQDIYGQWSGWVNVNSTIDQPDVSEPRIVSAEFKYTNVPVPPLTKCQANLVLEFLWDWRIRTPLTVSFRGRIYSASYHGAPPPNTALPNGLQTSLAAVPGTTFTLNFSVLAANGAPTSSWAGFNPLQHILALNPAGDQQVAFGNAQGQETRRYRVTIPGFELDFGPMGHIGLALWGEAVEAIAPKHAGNWSKEPSLISTSDPRPPVIAPDIVTLASLPDANGESHAVLKWSGSAGADGYFIYQTDESKMLKAVGEKEPDPSQTLSQRLTHLKAVFNAHPLERRTEFTRYNSKLIKSTSADIALPRGSTAIHLYTVLGVSAGQVEAVWPSSATALYAFASPRVPKPGTPTIEVSSVLDQTVTPNVYRSQIRIETRKGPRVKHIDVHRVRVDDAAKELDTMGPPVLTVDPLTAGWQVDQVTDALGSHITIAKGKETPDGSWKRVWYRVAAWSADDLLRGTLAARSPSSTVAWAVIPPNTPPDLSAITIEWPNMGPGDVLLKWTSAAPLQKTPLGDHRIAIRAKKTDADGDAPLIGFEAALSELGNTQPASGSGAWRVDGTKPQQYRALVRRADVNDAVDISVRVTDPLRRMSEALATIHPGSVLPAPVIKDFVQKKSVTPPGVVITWVSDTLLDPPVYVLTVTVGQPGKKVGNLIVRQLPIIITMPLASVPLDEPGPVPTGADPLRIRRMPGAGPTFNYYAFIRVPFTQVSFKLEAPDGRTAQHIEMPV